MAGKLFYYLQALPAVRCLAAADEELVEPYLKEELSQGVHRYTEVEIGAMDQAPVQEPWD